MLVAFYDNRYANPVNPVRFNAFGQTYGATRSVPRFEITSGGSPKVLDLIEMIAGCVDGCRRRSTDMRIAIPIPYS